MTTTTGFHATDGDLFFVTASGRAWYLWSEAGKSFVKEMAELPADAVPVDPSALISTAEEKAFLKKIEKAVKCEFGGCKNEAKWVARKLWGKGGQICTCDEHRPGSRPRPESMKNLPSFYDVQPIAKVS